METKTNIPATRIWLILARAYGSIASFVEQSIEDQGFCLSDFMVLEALLHKGPMPMSAIGEKILLASASMTSAIDRLEQRGLVARSNSEEDRRVRLVSLTHEGRKLIAALFRQHEHDLEGIAGDLSAEDRVVLYRALKQLGLAAKAAR